MLLWKMPNLCHAKPRKEDEENKTKEIRGIGDGPQKGKKEVLQT